MSGTGNVPGSNDCPGRTLSTLTLTLLLSSLNELKATLAIVVINDKEERAEITLVMILDVRKDVRQLLIGKVGVE